MIFNTTAFYQHSTGILAQWVSCNIVLWRNMDDMASIFWHKTIFCHSINSRHQQFLYLADCLTIHYIYLHPFHPMVAVCIYAQFVCCPVLNVLGCMCPGLSNNNINNNLRIELERSWKTKREDSSNCNGSPWLHFKMTWWFSEDFRLGTFEHLHIAKDVLPRNCYYLKYLLTKTYVMQNIFTQL